MNAAVLEQPQARIAGRRPRRLPRLTLAMSAAVIATYLYAIVVPGREQARRLQAEIDALRIVREELAARAAELTVEGPDSALPLARGAPARSIPARDLLPAVSTLGAQAGVPISTVKQISAERKAGESRVRMRARSDFAGIVLLLEQFAALSNEIELDDLVIRRAAKSGRPAELDVEAVVALRSPATVAPGAEE